MSDQCLKQWRDLLTQHALNEVQQQVIHGLGRRRGRPRLHLSLLLVVKQQPTAKQKQSQRHLQVPFLEIVTTIARQGKSPFRTIPLTEVLPEKKSTF